MSTISCYAAEYVRIGREKGKEAGREGATFRCSASTATSRGASCTSLFTSGRCNQPSPNNLPAWAVKILPRLEGPAERE